MSTQRNNISQHTVSRRQLLRLMGMSAAGVAAAACTPVAAPSGEASVASETAAETVDIRFWNHWLAAREELVNQMIADFEAENPTIDVENLGQPWDRREENMFTALASNNPPEVVMATRAEILQLAADGSIVPITDYVAAAELDLGRFYESEINNFYWEGELYSMPMPTGGGITGLTLVNVDMLEATGEEASVPETWQELEEMARAFTELDDRGIVVLGANVVGADSDGHAGPFFAWLYTNGGQIYSDDLRTITFNSPEGIETLEWMVDFTNEINGGVQNIYDFFITGQEANEAQPWYNDTQLINFPNVSIFFHMQTIKPEMQWEAGLRPYNADNPDAVSQGLSGEEFAWGYVIPAGVPEAKREAAFEWIRQLTYEEEGGGWFMKEQGRPSPIKAVNEDPEFYEVNPRWDVVLQSLESDVSVQIPPVHARIRDFVNQAVESALFGDATPEEALNQAAEQAQAVLDEYWSQQSQ